MFEQIINYFNENLIRKAEGILAIIGILSAFISGYYVIYKHIKKRKVFTNSDKPEIKYFTDREEITKEIFEKIEKSSKGELFSIYGPAGIGKSELMRLINMVFNSPKYFIDTETKSFLKEYSPEKFVKKKSQSYIFNCKDQEIQTVFSGIVSSLNLDIDNNTNISNFEIISSKIHKKTKSCDYVIFIFENIEKNYLASDLFEFFKILNSYSKKNKYIFFIVYSGLFSPGNGNSSVLKKVEKFKLENTKEFLEKHNLNNLSGSEISEIHKTTNGNLELLNIVTNIVKTDGKQELRKITRSLNLDKYFVEYLSEDDEACDVFNACLALSISQTIIVPAQVSILVEDGIDVSKNLTKLACAGFLNKINNRNSMYSISKVVRSIMYNSDSIDIIPNQVQLLKHVKNNRLNLEEKFVLHALFSVEDNHLVLETLKKKQEEKDYSIALEIYELLEISTCFSEHLIQTCKDFNQILFYILEALIGAGNYIQASDLIDNDMYSQYFITRDEHINENTLNLQFLNANLAHLKNDYNSALDIYSQLLNSDTVQKDIYYKAKITWGIAHVYRHIGNFEQAIEWYNQAIKICKSYEHKTLDVLIKCLNECNSIYVYLNTIPPFSAQYLKKIVQKNSYKFKNKVAELSTNKYEAIMLGKDNDFDGAISLIEETLSIYEKTFERLRFNLYFEKGELLRRKKNFKTAVQFFEKSFDSSQHNGDKNIRLYSLLGILLAELQSNQFYYHQDKNEQYKSLQKCFNTCYYKDSNDVRFELGLIHVNKVKELLDESDLENEFFREMLPLF